MALFPFGWEWFACLADGEKAGQIGLCLPTANWTHAKSNLSRFVCPGLRFCSESPVVLDVSKDWGQSQWPN